MQKSTFLKVLSLAISIFIPHVGRADALSIEARMVEQLRPHVKVVEREFSVFNYVQRENVKVPKNKALSPADPAVRAHFTDLANYFLASQPPRPQDKDSDDALGLYAAIDPMISQKYGNVLTMTRVRKGTRMLVETPSFGWSADLKKDLVAYGCVGYEFSGADFRHTMVSIAETPCRDVALKVLRALEVDLLAYSFGSYAPDGCNEDMDYAFVYIGNRALDFSTMKIFEQKIQEPDALKADRQAISTIMRAHPRFEMNFYDLWPKLKAASAKDVEKWSSENLLACQK